MIYHRYYIDKFSELVGYYRIHLVNNSSTHLRNLASVCIENNIVDLQDKQKNNIDAKRVEKLLPLYKDLYEKTNLYLKDTSSKIKKQLLLQAYTDLRSSLYGVILEHTQLEIDK